MSCEAGYEKVMFLAEDRVMGFELLSSKEKDHRLSFSTEATCYTDACDTADELLKQRRRWINSAFVCRNWSLVNFTRYWRDSGSSIFTKLQTTGSVLSMLWSNIFDWFVPLLVMCLVVSNFNAIQSMSLSFGISNTLPWILSGLIGLGWLLPTLLAMSGRLQHFSKKNSERIFGVASLSTVGCGGVLTTSADFTAIAAIAGVIFTLLCLAAILAKPALYGLVKSLPRYLLCALPVSLMLNTYAFFNMNDSSWGTKGLTKTEDKKNEILQKRLNGFGNKFVAVWLTTNLVAFTLATYFDAAWFVITAFGVLIVSYIGLGGIGLACLKIKDRKQPAYPNPRFEVVVAKHS
jgi:cellulose synthase/poly-beta-1,6-N-acetylglucosamine synthase-like glycosyltransferase